MVKKKAVKKSATKKSATKKSATKKSATRKFVWDPWSDDGFLEWIDVTFDSYAVDHEEKAKMLFGSVKEAFRAYIGKSKEFPL